MGENKKKILIIDDEKDVVTVVSMRLKAEGYLVNEAFSVTGGIDSIRKDRPDLIILDIILPDGNGSDLCEKLKGDPETRDIIIITFSASTQRGVLKKTLSKGAVDYIVKPFDSKELLEKIRRVLT